MPELPEVETVKRGLHALILKREVSSVKHDWDKSFPNAKSDVDEFLIGSKIIDVRRRAKVLIIDLSTEYSLLIHLKMTGQLVFVEYSQKQIKDKRQEKKEKSRFGAGHPNDSLVNSLPDKSTRVTFTFKDGSNLFFNDQRKFGWVKLFPTVEVENIEFIREFGPEPLSDDFTSTKFIERVRKRAGTTIKAAILDQTVLAGVGNIYADESLFAAKIHPATRVKDVTNAKLKLLLKKIKDVLQLSIDKGGSSDRNYVNAEGKKGSYLGFAKVFRREGKPCSRCGTTIEKIRVAGRGTHICPKCQKR